MKAEQKRQKVSLLFYSEEEGKKIMVDKWTLEPGKKYIIGRSKKKVDISIQDITISRIHSEFIFYDRDKIMVKDYNSSNGTYINKQRIEPNKENYFSIRDTLSIGDEKKELIFSIQNNEEETNIRNDFDNLMEKQKNKEEIKKKNKIQKNYYENENEEIKNKNYFKRKKSGSFYRNSSSRKNENFEDDYYEADDKKYQYRNKKYEQDSEKNIGSRYKDSKHKNKKHRYKSHSRSRSRSNSRKKSYNKIDDGYRRNKKYSDKKHLTKSSSSDSEESSKKNKHKNILSYIVKREEEIEKENDKKQIKLYNEYLKIKEETEAKSEMNNLPNLLPVLIAKSENEDSDSGSIENKTRKGKNFKKEFITLAPTLKKKLTGGIIKNFKNFNRNDYGANKRIIKNYPGYRNKIKLRRRDNKK